MLVLVRFIGDYGSELSVLPGNIYECIRVYDSWYRIIDETDEDYLYPKEDFEIVEDKND